ncbi:MAG: RNA polymerase sigma factor [Candidatus Polarisedimenticolia bacterium]
MPYDTGTIERRLLDNDLEALGLVTRWIAVALTSPRFWSLRTAWPDITQDILMRVVESLKQDRYDTSRDFRAYVQGITRHAALEELERQLHARRKSGADRSRPDPGSGPEQETIRRQMVRRILDLTSEECRSLIRAYFFDDRAYAEIAESLGVPVGTVKSRLYRCLEAAHFSLHGTARPGNQSRSWANKEKTEEHS